MKTKHRNFNSTKKRALGILEDQQWMDVPTFAHAAGIHPARRAYTYLAHLARLGLVIKGKTDNGRHYYRITPRGLERLEWLRRGSSSDPLRSLAADVLHAVRPSDGGYN